MTQAHKFGANRDQGLPRGGAWRAGGRDSPGSCPCRLVIAATTAIAARAAIVSIAPATAAVYAGVGMPVNLRGLSIADVRATVTRQTESQGELLVTGEIANLRDRETPVPNLRLALRAKMGASSTSGRRGGRRLASALASASHSGRGWRRLRPAFATFW